MKDYLDELRDEPGMDEPAIEPVKPDTLNIPNPYQHQKEQVKRTLEHLEKAETTLAKMGVVYQTYKNEQHEAFIQAIYLIIHQTKEDLKDFYVEFM